MHTPDPNLPFRFSTPEESNGFLLWQVTMLWQRKIRRVLDPLNLTHVQFVLLAALGWLARESKAVTQTDLANHSKIDRMMTSKVLRTLQEKGFIKRAEHETDTRAKAVTLTESGRDILQAAVRVVEATDVDFFAKLEEDTPAFNRHMQRLLRSNED